MVLTVGTRVQLVGTRHKLGLNNQQGSNSIHNRRNADDGSSNDAQTCINNHATELIDDGIPTGVIVEIFSEENTSYNKYRVNWDISFKQYDPVSIKRSIKAIEKPERSTTRNSSRAATKKKQLKQSISDNPHYLTRTEHKNGKVVTIINLNQI